MVLILDFIAILFIIALSYILSMNVKTTDTESGNNIHNSLLSHIVVGLSVIVFYKLARYFKLTNKLNTTTTNLNTIPSSSIKEPFNNDTVSQSINDFISNTNTSIISNDQVNTLTPVEFANYTQKIDSLVKSITDLKTQINAPSALNSSMPANMSSMDLAAQQQYQMFQINFLQNQIKNAQDVINASSIAKSSVNYKPIKVFSSCVVSNANGDTTIEQSVGNKTSSLLGGLPGTALSGSGSGSSTSNQILNTISQSNNQTSGPVLNVSPSTGMLGSVLSNTLSLGNVNIS